MPYVVPVIRDDLTPDSPRSPENSGELNFALTKVVERYLRHHGLRYATINDVVGALEGAKAEFQRRVVAPYEDSKVEQNGDVYPVELTEPVKVLACNAPIALPCAKYDGSGNVSRRVNEYGDHQVWVAYATGGGRWETVER